MRVAALRAARFTGETGFPPWAPFPYRINWPALLGPTAGLSPAPATDAVVFADQRKSSRRAGVLRYGKALCQSRARAGNCRRGHGRIHPTVLGARRGGRCQLLPDAVSGDQGRRADPSARSRRRAGSLRSDDRRLSRGRCRDVEANRERHPRARRARRVHDRSVERARLRGEVLRDTRTTYHLLATPEGWRLLSYTNHF